MLFWVELPHITTITIPIITIPSSSSSCRCMRPCLSSCRTFPSVNSGFMIHCIVFTIGHATVDTNENVEGHLHHFISISNTSSPSRSLQQSLPRYLHLHPHLSISIIPISISISIPPSLHPSIPPSPSPSPHRNAFPKSPSSSKLFPCHFSFTFQQNSWIIGSMEDCASTQPHHVDNIRHNIPFCVLLVRRQRFCYAQIRW